jgi:hypothetical protein
MTNRWLPLALALLALLPAQAATFYTSPTDFGAAIAGLPSSTLDFESSAPGTLLPDGSTSNGITFNYTIFGLNLTVVNNLPATSGTRSLGLDDPTNDNLFLAGDVFTMSFAPSRAIGLYVITSNENRPIVAGDILLVTPLGTALNGASPWSTLPGGYNVFFLGVVADLAEASFTSATLDFDDVGKGQFSFHVDDITRASEIPEPSMGLAVLVGLAALGLARRRSALRA